MGQTSLLTCKLKKIQNINFIFLNLNASQHILLLFYYLGVFGDEGGR